MSDSEILAPGKLPGALLDRLLRTYVQPHPSVLIGPEVGADAAAIAVGEGVIVVKTDPITFPTPDIASYLVNVNANDIACMGAEPRWLLVTTLLPEGRATEAMVEEQFRSLAATCKGLGIALAGGHTEVTVGLDRPLMVGMMIGETSEDELLDLRAARAGDTILLCNSIALEGTSILASEATPEELKAVPAAALERARNLMLDPGISVVPAARALRASGAEIRGMHDPTEGGIATALHELARITDCQVRLDGDPLPVLDETRLICDALGLDPLGLIASGALLAVTAGEQDDTLLESLRDQGFNVVAIGTLATRSPSDPRAVDREGNALAEYSTDEIARYFATRDAGTSA